MAAQNPPEQVTYWDSIAATYDDYPDHGLTDPSVLRAWIDLLRRWLPAQQANILDAGCGTGSLSVVLAGLGHRVTGIDASPAMLDRARAKTAALACTIDFYLMDAAAPQLQPQSFDVVVCRHVLWTLAEPAAALARWADLLTPRGRLVLIEGCWSTGPGMHAAEVVAALPAAVAVVAVEDLSADAAFWGKQVDDQRYVVVADRTN
ncbi:MAG: class I SAM-dependent methyltransferase [Caldilineales bacterium]